MLPYTYKSLGALVLFYIIIIIIINISLILY